MNPLQIVATIGDLIGGWFKRKHEIQKKELEFIQQQDINEFQIEFQKQKNLEGSWKDEYVTVVMTLPLLMLFAGFDEQVFAAFQALDETPEWYQWLMMGVISAAAGVPLYGKLAKFNAVSKMAQ